MFCGQQVLAIERCQQQVCMGHQLKLGIGQQDREHFEGQHHGTSTVCLTPCSCLDLPNRPNSLVPLEQPLPKLKPHEFFRSNAFSAYSRWVVGMTKRSS